MSSEKQKYSQIEDYLKGKMSPEAREAFQLAMSKDPQLREEVMVQKFAYESFQMEYLQNVSALVRERVKQPAPVSKYWWIGGAAFVLTLVAVAVFWPASPEKSVETNKGEMNRSIANSIGKGDSVAVGQNDPEEIKNHISSDKVDSKIENKKTDTSAKGTDPEVKPVVPPLTAVKDTSVKPAKKDNKERETLPAVKPVKDCPKEKPSVNVQIASTDYDEPSGVITLHFKDTKSWQVYLEGANGNFENRSSFRNLAAASYTLSVKDTQNCIYRIGEYVVPSSCCSHKKDYVFNISTDLEWKVPVSTEISYKVSIFNKAGTEVYGASFDGMESSVWNGLTNSGAKSDIGLHKAIVKFSDNKTCIYNVVVAE